MRTRGFYRSVAAAICAALLGCLALPDLSHAATAQAIDEAANKILVQFKQKHEGATEALKQAKGVLIFPQIIQAGFIVGGSYGEGVLRINGTSVAYYSIGSGAFGLIAGAQAKAAQLNRPIVSFTLDQSGLMVNLSLQGAKITKINR